METFPTACSGLLLGFAAGISPGPLLTLVVSQTLTHGMREGIKVAAAPLITDLPIILLALWAGSRLAENPLPLGILSVMGSVYVGFLAWESFKVNISNQGADQAPKSMRKGILTNLMNPHPYLFWMTVGTPLLLRTWAAGPWGAVLWLSGFYVMLVGAKIVLSVVVGCSRKFLYGKFYLWLNRFLGLVLLVFAIVLVKDGIRLISGG